VFFRKVRIGLVLLIAAAIFWNYEFPSAFAGIAASVAQGAPVSASQILWPCTACVFTLVAFYALARNYGKAHDLWVRLGKRFTTKN